MNKIEAERLVLVTRAADFAIAAHQAVGQVRKYTGEPYWLHPRDVAQLVQFFSKPGELGDFQKDEVIAAAWLHDVVEDTKVTIDDIMARFGNKVAWLVSEVTDVSKPEDGNRAIRKALDRDHLAKASPAGKTIKLADIICNTASIVKHDPEFAKIYLKEKEELLPLLTSGSRELWDMANVQLARFASTP